MNANPTFKIYTKAEESFSLTVRNNAVVLAPANQFDECQHWFKDFRWSTQVKDQDGFPAFALVNKATGLAIKHAKGLKYTVRLTQFDPDLLDESILWTEGNDIGEGYRCVKTANDIKFLLDAYKGIKKYGGVHDGTEIKLWEWNGDVNQKWKILPYSFFHAETSHVCCSQPKQAIEGTNQPIPISSLSLLLDGIKNLTKDPLTYSNHYIWSRQLIKLFKANGYSHLLTKSESIPPRHIPSDDGTIIENPSYSVWEMVDNKIAFALCSTFSDSILYDVVSLETTADIWESLSRKFECINRSRVIELKNQLHHLKIEDISVHDYITKVKHIVDLLAAAGANVDKDDVVLYMLNGLSPAYQPFQATIRSKKQPMDLDEFYALLASEATSLANVEDFTTVQRITNNSTNRGFRFK